MSDRDPVATSTSADESKSASSRKPAVRKLFPRYGLSKVLPLLGAIWEDGHGDAVRTTAAFAKIGKSPSSGPSKQLLAAATTGYGLATANSGATYLSLTEEGKAIASLNPGPERNQAIREALFRNPVFSAVHARYKDRPLPSDQVVSDFIKLENGLSDDDARACWAIMSENLKFAGLITREGSADVIVDFPAANDSTDAGVERDTGLDIAPVPSRSDSKSSHHARSSSLSVDGPKVDHGLTADFHINLQIHLPSEASPETYDSIFESISKHLLNRPN